MRHDYHVSIEELRLEVFAAGLMLRFQPFRVLSGWYDSGCLIKFGLVSPAFKADITSSTYRES